MDEIASPADANHPDAESTAAKGPVRAYHEAVLSQRQPKVTDLLPVRPLWVFVFLLLGLSGIAGIEAIHVHVATLKLDGAEHLAALDTRQRGSLDDWYASAMLAAAATLSLVVFGVRSHRVDDYRGHYRVWLWTAAALVWLSLDAATGIHDALGFFGVAVGRAANHGDPQVVITSLAAGTTLTWIAVYTLVFGGLGLRLAFEVFASRLATMFLITAGLLYTTAALLQLQIITAPATLTAGLAESTIILLAHFSLLAAVGFNARHVLLDAGGRLKVHIDPDRRRKTKRAAARPRATASTGSGVLGGNQQSSATGIPTAKDSRTLPASKPTVAITKSTLTSPPDSGDEDDDSDDEAYAGLSRSERRRLKKLARREQRRAA